MLKIFSNFIPIGDFLTGMNDTSGSTDFYRNGNDDLKYKSISLSYYLTMPPLDSNYPKTLLPNTNENNALNNCSLPLICYSKNSRCPYHIPSLYHN